MADNKDHLISPEERIAAEKARKQFFDYVDSLPDVDLTDPKVRAELYARLGEKIRPGIEKIDRAEAETAGRAFTMLVR